MTEEDTTPRVIEVFFKKGNDLSEEVYPDPPLKEGDKLILSMTFEERPDDQPERYGIYTALGDYNSVRAYRAEAVYHFEPEHKKNQQPD